MLKKLYNLFSKRDKEFPEKYIGQTRYCLKCMTPNIIKSGTIGSDGLMYCCSDNCRHFDYWFGFFLNKQKAELICQDKYRKGHL